MFRSRVFLFFIAGLGTLCCSNAADRCVSAAAAEAVSPFNISVDCSNSGLVFVNWTTIDDYTNWISLYYHCASNNTDGYEVADGDPRSSVQKSVTINPGDETSECVLSGCYEKDVRTHPIVRITNINCTRSADLTAQLAATTVSPVNVSSIVNGENHDGTSKILSTKLFIGAGLALLVCLLVWIGLVGVAAKVKQYRKRINSGNLNIHVDPIVVLEEIRSIDSTDIAYSGLNLVDTGNAASDDGRLFKNQADTRLNPNGQQIE